MADYKYSYNGPEEHTARALLKDSHISTKVAIEMCNYLKGKSTTKALVLLESVLKKEHAIPFTRFTNGVGHRKGPLSSGRYPQKASQAFIDMIKLAETNASQSGLSSELQIIHLTAHKASTSWHFGRQRRRKNKSTHVEIVVKELEEKKTKKKAVAKKEVTETKTEEVVKEPVKVAPVAAKAVVTKAKEPVKEKTDEKVALPKAKKVEEKLVEKPVVQATEKSPSKKETSEEEQ